MFGQFIFAASGSKVKALEDNTEKNVSFLCKLEHLESVKPEAVTKVGID